MSTFRSQVRTYGVNESPAIVADLKDQRCVIQRGALAGLSGVVVGYDAERDLIRLECLPGVTIAMASQNLAVVTRLT